MNTTKDLEYLGLAASDEDLIIVAVNYKDTQGCTPFTTKYGICFYAGYLLDREVFLHENPSARQIKIAAENTINRVLLLDNIYQEDMTIVTSNDFAYGSGILCCKEFMRKLKETFGDYYILPSSIHEVIIVPKDAEIANRDTLLSSIYAVNGELETASENIVLSYDLLESEDWI